MKHHEGFTLLEVLIAMALLLIGLIGGIQLLATGQRITQAVTEKTDIMLMSSSFNSRVQAVRTLVQLDEVLTTAPFPTTVQRLSDSGQCSTYRVSWTDPQQGQWATVKMISTAGPEHGGSILMRENL